MSETSSKWTKRLAGLTPMLVVSSMVLAACGGEATPTTAPSGGTGGTTVDATATTGTGGTTADATATATTGGMAEATATTGSMASETATTGTSGMADETPTTGTGGTASETSTTGGATGGSMVPQGAATITFWHGYTGAEADALTQALQQLSTENPQFKVNVLAVPFDSLKQKVTTEAATGGGPDVFIGPNDWSGELAEAGLLANLDDQASLTNITSGLVPSSLGIAKYNDKQYGIPANMKAVALYYNKDLVKTVPANTDELLTQASALATGDVQYGLALNAQFYHMVGFNYAFGGKLFTDPQTVDFTQQGSIDWLTWMKKAKDTPGVFAKGGADQDIDNLFKSGKAAMLINGPWALGDYQKALGADKVGVAVVPDTPSGGKFAPFVGGDIYYVNASAKDPKAALDFIGYMTSAPAQQIMVDNSGQISTNTKVDLSKQPALEGFVKQASQGTPFPNYPAMAKVWDPAGNMITSVLDGKATPEEAAKTATDAINSAIKAGGGR